MMRKTIPSMLAAVGGACKWNPVPLSPRLVRTSLLSGFSIAAGGR